jgi:hypothetical protein
LAGEQGRESAGNRRSVFRSARYPQIGKERRVRLAAVVAAIIAPVIASFLIPVAVSAVPITVPAVIMVKTSAVPFPVTVDEILPVVSRCDPV